MTVVRTNTPYGFAMFCDDFRVEGNSKQILIGVYTSIMYVTAFPVVLPTFHVLIRYHERPKESDQPVKLVITAPGYETPVFSADVTREQIEATKIPDDPEVDDPMIIMNVTAAFHPLLLKTPGRIKVRAYRGEDEIRLGTLRVELFPANTLASSEATKPIPKSKEAAN